MTRPLTIMIVVSLFATLAACSKDDSAEKNPAGEQASKAGAEHAAADVEPGSHADWCGEHAVPESQCTRCNPELAAAFKATNDWCDEHGVPESQCLACNPELKIVRPPPSDPGRAEE